MNQQIDLTFLKKLLEQLRLNVHVISKTESNFEHIDKGFRQYLGLNSLYELTANLMKMQLTPNTIYAISDDFYANYFVMELPNEEESCFLVIGPYTEQNFTETDLLVLTERHQIPKNIRNSLQQYYANIPFISDPSPIRLLLGTFYEVVWGNNESCRFEDIHHKLPEHYAKEPANAILEKITDEVDIAFKMQVLEERYRVEGVLIKYISQGNYDKAAATLAGVNNAFMENRASTRLRDYKNYSIVLNTLLRKGAEVGMVHPIHIDKLSSYFAKKIETITSLEQGKTLLPEMIRKYCLLVKNHSLKEYSLLVQKIVTRIDADLTADQSLKVHAKLLNVHPSYLSSLFRKETGVTLTEYVNQKRVEYGIFLLNTTNMQIQTVAQHCGIPDINYFTRIFKKQIGKTPSEYKKTLHK